MATRTSSTVIKALDLIDRLVEGEAEQSVGRLAAATGIHKSTVVRLCRTLVARGYMRQARAGSYRLGPRIGDLAKAYGRQFSLEDAVRPVLARLRDATGESASLYVSDGAERICLYRENSHHRIRHHVDEGARLPFRAGVVGRVLLAFAGEKGRVYAAIRKAGYLSAEGREPHTASISAPVLTGGGALAGAIVISGLAMRFTEDARARALDLVLRSCAELSRQLPEGG